MAEPNTMIEEIRIDVLLDDSSESMRYVATAIKGGKTIHTIKVYGLPEAAYRKMTEWLQTHGYPVPTEV